MNSGHGFGMLAHLQGWIQVHFLCLSLLVGHRRTLYNPWGLPKGQEVGDNVKETLLVRRAHCERLDWLGAQPPWLKSRHGRTLTLGRVVERPGSGRMDGGSASSFSTAGAGRGSPSSRDAEALSALAGLVQHPGASESFTCPPPLSPLRNLPRNLQADQPFPRRC